LSPGAPPRQEGVDTLLGDGDERDNSCLRCQIVRFGAGIEDRELIQLEICKGDTHRRGEFWCIHALDFDAQSPSAL
jgi:hypothetical protein